MFMSTSLEYVIYCRKSTDESSGQQNQSIPDQIQKCVDYAEKEWLTIKHKPKDFEFESDSDIFKEDNDTDILNRQIYSKYRHLYIIKEQQSAKTPWKRPKWKRLISLIKQGKIKGLLSYSPDRQARNMMEGWELINCVDEWLVDLKYTNFHFENNASGKMMLGIRFVFSKQYSDKLSEDITRGNKTTVLKGKSMWDPKYGYMRDEENGYYMPHSKNFPLMRTAFEMKIYDNASDEYIANRLNAHWYIRETKDKVKAVNPKMLYRVWEDPFYYGIYVRRNNTVDLRENNPFYEALITENEYWILFDRKMKNKPRLSLKEVKDEYDEIIPLKKWLLISKDWFPLIFNLPSKYRYYNKLILLKKEKPKATLKDVVKPNQIRFKVANKLSRDFKLEITFNLIDKEILRVLDKVKINKEAYDRYVKFVNEKLDGINEENKRQRNMFNLQINKLSSQKKDYIQRNMSLSKTKDEESVYRSQLTDYDQKIELIQKEMEAITVSERNTILELEVFIHLIKNVGEDYKKANYVQKRRIASIMLSNIVVDKQKRLTIGVKPWLEPLFEKKNSFGGDDGVRTHV